MSNKIICNYVRSRTSLPTPNLFLATGLSGKSFVWLVILEGSEIPNYAALNSGNCLREENPVLKLTTPAIGSGS